MVGTVNVRRGRAEDAEALIGLGYQMHQEGAYAFLPFDREKVRRFILQGLEHPENSCVLVAEEAGAVVGMLGGYLSDYFFCDERIACDAVFFVEPGHRTGVAAVKLVEAFREWALEHKARELCMAVSSGENADRAARFYIRMGLSPVGGVYKQRLGDK
jgi:GNAT superfamily N-acetyltransferase